MKVAKSVLISILIIIPSLLQANESNLKKTDSLSADIAESMPEYLASIPKFSTDSFDLFLSGRLSVGGSSFTWKDGPVSGKPALALDAVAQFYTNDKVSFLPSRYYGEASFGYALMGASQFPMHYLDLHLLPLGLYRDYKQLRMVGKLGLYTGFPLSQLRYTNDANVDFGISCGAAVEYRMLSVGLSFDHGFVNISPSPVKLYNWGLMLQITCKLLSFNQ